MKFKTMYQGGLYSTAITVKELKRIVKEYPADEWENALRLHAFLGDECPQMYGDPTEDKDEADASYNPTFRIEEGAGGRYDITCTGTEEFTAREIEDGWEFYEGSNFWHTDAMTEEQKQMLMEL